MVNETLQNVATKDLATPEIEQSLIQARSFGQKQLERFVEQRLLLERGESEENTEEEGTKENFRDPIHKNNPATFANLYEVKPLATTSERKKILNADRSILYRLVMAYEAGRDVNLSAILQHEIINASARISCRNEPDYENRKQVYFG